MKALIYLRVSTDKQAEKGLSLPTQKEQCLGYATRLGYKVSENDIYTDAGESARNEDRAEFQRMLMRCREDKDVGAIIVYDLSRFSRNGVEYFITKKSLEKFCVKILSVSETSIGKDNATSSEWLLEWMMVGFNENRSRQDGEKILLGMKRKASEGGYPARAPFGYVNKREVISGDKNRAWIEIDPKEALWVEKAFNLYATGNHSLQDITDTLWKEGFPSRNGKKPHKSFIESMLRNKTYIGWVVWVGVENPNGKHKPIIENTLFEKVQAVREAHNVGADRTRKHLFVLRGVAKCGECGSRWTAGYHKGASGKKYGLYSCQKAQKGQRVSCSQEGIPIDDLEVDFAKIFKQVQLPDNVIEKIRTKVKAIFSKEEEVYEKMRKTYLAEETKLKSQQSRLVKLYMNNSITDEQYEQEKINLEIQEKQTKENSAKIEHEVKDVVRVIEIAIGLANNCYRTYKKAPHELKALLAHAFFKEIIIKDRQIVSATLNPPIDYFCAKRLQVNPVFQLDTIGGPYRTRTCHLLIANEAL